MSAPTTAAVEHKLLPLAPEELRGIRAFADLPEDGLVWLAALMHAADLAPGEVLVREGSRAEYLCIVLHGEFRGQREGDGSDQRVYTARAGEVTGMLPFSRLTTFPLTSRALRPSRVALLHKDHFPAMLERLPQLGQRLVNIMADRIREVTKMDVQREKMAALGKLSAGLAHELNNPASAARRAAESLKEAVEAQRLANIRLDERSLTVEQRALLSCVEREIAERPEPLTLDSLDRSDREEAIGHWLMQRGIARSWDLAPGLVECGFDVGCLNEVSSLIPAEALDDAFTRLTSSITVRRLVAEIENSTGRIVDLVQAIKEYSYMDQMPEQDVDIRQGLENTLTMLRHRLKNGITLQRDYDPELPPVSARGSELNQVWTNLIDNALDAMDGNGELGIRTAFELDQAVVEIHDTGAGISPEIHDHIFEPFFTTKNVGQGMGLGLDTVYRIVRSHRGDISFDSKPGDTRFVVRLPTAAVADHA